MNTTFKKLHQASAALLLVGVALLAVSMATNVHVEMKQDGTNVWGGIFSLCTRRGCVSHTKSCGSSTTGICGTIKPVQGLLITACGLAFASCVWMVWALKNPASGLGVSGKRRNIFCLVLVGSAVAWTVGSVLWIKLLTDEFGGADKAYSFYLLIMSWVLALLAPIIVLYSFKRHTMQVSPLYMEELSLICPEAVKIATKANVPIIPFFILPYSPSSSEGSANASSSARPDFALAFACHPSSSIFAESSSYPSPPLSSALPALVPLQTLPIIDASKMV